MPNKERLNLTIDAGEEKCQVITLYSDGYSGTIYVRDVWAELFNEQGNLNQYTFTSTDHGISISYIDTFLDFENSANFEVCIIASNPGKYLGAIIFSPKTEGNVVVEIGTWILLHVSEPSQPTTTPPLSGGGSSSKNSGDIALTIEQPPEENIELLASPEEPEQTAEQTQEQKNLPEKEQTALFTPFRIFPFILIIGLVTAAVLIQKKRKSFIKK
ncbi:MAG: hypothetical protein ABII03_01255 [Nanoarchaeota archaeon]